MPPQTRLFWEAHVPGSEDFEKFLSQFRSNTFRTGVYMGYGIDLFSERVKIGEQLLLDANPAIAMWAEQFVAESEAMLKHGRDEQAVYQARLDLER